MRLYLDVSCLNRPLDDQQQTRVRLESEAIDLILEKIDDGRWTHVSSEMVLIEIDAAADRERRRRLRRMLPPIRDIIQLTDAIFRRAEQCQSMGFKAADAVHIAAAEALKADVLLTCDDRLNNTARRHQPQLRVRVMNPLAWLEE